MGKCRGMVYGVVALLVAHTAAAQAPRIVGLTPGRGEVGFEFDGTWHGYDGGIASRDGGYRQWLSLPVSGSFIDQRIFSYDLTLSPGLSQRVNTRLAGPLSSARFGYDLSVRMLTGWHASATVMAARQFGSGGNALVGRNNFETSQFASTVYLRTALVPVSFTYSRRSSRDEWALPGVSTTLGRYDAWQGWKVLAQSSKTRITAQRTFYDDLTNGGDFSLLTVGLDHSWRWGRGSTLGSSVELERRDRNDAHVRRRWLETVHLQHGRRVSSDHTLMAQSRRSAGGAAISSQSAGTAVNYQPYRWLGLGGNASHQSARWREGRTSSSSLAPRVDLRGGLPAGGSFTGGAGLGYERRTEQATGDGMGPVADEAHTVTAGRSFFLEQFDVDPASVVLRRADQTLVYQSGVDYRLVPAGARVQVEVLPGGRIAEGETLLASYRYRLRPSTDARAVVAQFQATIAVAGLQAVHTQSLRHELGIGAPDTLRGVGDVKDTYTQLGGARRTPAGWVQVTASRRSLVARAADHVTYELGGSLALPSVATFQAKMGGSIARAASADRRRTTWAARLSASGAVSGHLRLEGGLEAWTWRPDRGLAERSISASAGLSGSFGAWEAVLRYQHQRRETTVGGADHRLSVRLLRRL